MTTHDALVTTAGSRFKDPSNNVISAAEWSEYLNTCYAFVNAASAVWPWLEVVAPGTLAFAQGTATAALPGDVLTIQNAWNTTDDFPLVPLVGDRQQLTIYDTNNAQQGMPTNYRLVGGSMIVYPVPDHAVSVKIEYLLGPTALSTTIEPVWPEMYHRILVTGMLSLAYGDDGNPKEAERRWALFEKEIGQMMRQVLSTRDQGYPGIEDAWYGR